MAHVRKQIRDAVETLLSASPTNWNRVFNSRIAPQRDVLPYLMVFTASEVSEPIDIHGTPEIYRDIQLSVRGHCRVSSDGDAIEDEMDAMAAEIESTLTFTALNTALSNKVLSLHLQATELDIVQGENERTYAEIALDWRVRVHTVEGDAETLV